MSGFVFNLVIKTFRPNPFLSVPEPAQSHEKGITQEASFGRRHYLT